MIETELIEVFLDQVAEFFDNGTPIHPDTLLEDSAGYAISAQALLQRIRLHEAVNKVTRKGDTNALAGASDRGTDSGTGTQHRETLAGDPCGACGHLAKDHALISGCFFCECSQFTRQT